MFADELVSILVDAGVGVAGSTIFIGPKPAVPSVAIPAVLTVSPSGGAAPEGTHNSTLLPAYVRPSAQLLARGIKYSDAETMIQRAYEAVFPVRNRFVQGTWWVKVLIKQEPFPLGEDENARPMIAFNIDVTRRYSPATS